MSTFLYGAHVHANGIRQHYLRYGGHGPALILIPGITSPAITRGFVAERLGEKYDVYVLDVRGRGLSSSGPELAYDAETCAQDVNAFAAALNWPVTPCSAIRWAPASPCAPPFCSPPACGGWCWSIRRFPAPAVAPIPANGRGTPTRSGSRCRA